MGVEFFDFKLHTLLLHLFKFQLGISAECFVDGLEPWTHLDKDADVATGRHHVLDRLQLL